MRTVTPKQKRFCKEYLVDFNGKRAAIRAKFSVRTAASQASNMLAMPHIKAYIAKIGAPKEMDLTVTAERVLRELARLAFHDPGVYYKRDPKGKIMLRDLDELTEDQRAAIAEYNPETKTLKLYSKDPSLDKLGKHLKLFTELHEQQHTFTIMPVVKRGGRELVFNVGLPKPAAKQ